MNHDVPQAGVDLPEQPLAFARFDAFDTATLSPEVVAMTRKNEAIILRGLREKTGAAVALALGMSDSALSRWASGGALRLAALVLAVLGLKVVPSDAIVYLKPEEFN